MISGAHMVQKASASILSEACQTSVSLAVKNAFSSPSNWCPLDLLRLRYPGSLISLAGFISYELVQLCFSAVLAVLESKFLVCFIPSDR